MARYTSKHPIISVTADVVAFAVDAGVLQVALVTRGDEPHRGKLALPGGFINPDETLAAAAGRELAEETGLTKVSLEQLAAYGGPGRDPRGPTVSVAFMAALPEAVTLRAGDDAAAAAWHPVAGLLKGRNKLAFDHKQIISDAVAALGVRLERTTVATTLVRRDFTLSELRAAYEAVWGVELDPGNFQRKVLGIGGFVVPTGEVRASVGRGRPAATYRSAGKAVRDLETPISRPSV